MANRGQIPITCLVILLVIFVTTAAKCDFSLASVQQEKSHTGRGVGTGSMPVAAPVIQGEADGAVLPFNYGGEDLKASILAQPPPEVWLAFPASDKQEKTDGTSSATAPVLRIELPLSAKQLLSSQWAEVLAAKYQMEIEGERDAQSHTRNLVTIVNSFKHSELGLKKIYIDAPDGRRTISQDETRSLASFINSAATDIIKQAKENKK
jgi:hypothetical protein